MFAFVLSLIGLGLIYAGALTDSAEMFATGVVVFVIGIVVRVALSGRS